MAFWSAEVKPDEPYVLEPSGRLCITQATIGNCDNIGWTTLECGVGDATPVRLCCLNSRTATYRLELEFEEKKSIVLSVLGSCSVHLSGYHIRCHNADNGSYTEKASGKATSLAYIKRENHDVTHGKNAGSGSLVNPIMCDGDDNNGGDHSSIPATPSHASTSKKRKYKTRNIQMANKQRCSKMMDYPEVVDIVDITQEVNDIHSAGQENKTQEDESSDKDIRYIDNSSIPTALSNALTSKKRKYKKQNTQVANKQRCSKMMDYPEVVDIVDITQEVNDIHSADQENKTPEDESSDKDIRDGGHIHKKTPDGTMLIENLECGDPKGNMASKGKKVRVKYAGKFEDGRAFDPTEGSGIYEFELGVGHVILGWDRGIDGMRVGDKRRLTIPPSMGYGSRPVKRIPANSWLFYEVELLSVSRPKKNSTASANHH